MNTKIVTSCPQMVGVLSIRYTYALPKYMSQLVYVCKQTVRVFFLRVNGEERDVQEDVEVSSRHGIRAYM